MGVRYLIGFLGFLPFLPKMKKLTKQHWKIAIIAGTLCWISFATQTYGIKMTTATKSAFLTGLNVIMVPIFSALLFKTKISRKIWLSSFLAVIGVSVFSFGEFNKFEFGDVLILVCDVFYAFYIIYLDRHLKKVDILSFSAVIVLVIGVNSFILSFLVEDYSIILNFSNEDIYNVNNFIIMLYMGLFATTLATLTQTFGQSVISSTRAAIIFALEPIFATFFAVLFGDDRITVQVIIGGTIVMVGIYISLIPTKSIEKKVKKAIIDI
jgi:drug/metabolite transporter (DMT)-like permease